MHERHGETKTRLYTTWRGMRWRCNNPRGTNARWYAGKGVRVCDEWSSFPAFKAWAEANGYREGLTLDRIDPNGHYEPANCRWATMLQQAENRTDVRPVEINGETLCILAWSKRTGIGFTTLYKRYNKGVRGEALIAPPRVPAWKKLTPR
jgi:hypothetical protein